MILEPPVLSLADPVLEGEGSVDPFGTGVTYERMAERILPFITARMARPRFLTAMVVGAHVCSGLEERLAADGTSPAWIVFEWYVVEAHARSSEWVTDTTGLRRVAGIDKVSGAIRRGQRVCHGTYLKTAKVYGFTGIYKRLARGLQILTDDLTLDEGGYQLLAQWEREQRLEGFISGREGEGARLRQSLRAAVEAGLAAGHTDRPPRWPTWEPIVRHLRADRAGRGEASWLFARLSDPRLRPAPGDSEATAMRSELVAHLVDNGRELDIEDEAAFLRGIASRASPGLTQRLDAIDAFEGLCRPIEDAFRLILHLSTQQGGAPVDAKTFAAHPGAVRLLDGLRTAVERVQRTEPLLEWEPDAESLAGRYEGVSRPQGLFEVLLRHHEETQREKPPDGKRPWFERATGDRVVARQQYTRREPPEFNDLYVHPYRVSSVSSFLRDLGRIPA